MPLVIIEVAETVPVGITEDRLQGRYPGARGERAEEVSDA